MSGRCFFDTNVLVYSLSRGDLRKSSIAESRMREAIELRMGVISYQVVQELLNVSLRETASRTAPRMTIPEARTYLEGLKEMEIVPSSFQLIARALEVRERHRFHWYDSLIVAAALEGKCETLYTEDLQHGQNVDGLIVMNPFLETAM